MSFITHFKKQPADILTCNSEKYIAMDFSFTACKQNICIWMLDTMISSTFLYLNKTGSAWLNLIFSSSDLVKLQYLQNAT